MRAKPKISRRTNGCWIVSRPPVGFRQLPDETEHTSWRDAVNSLTEPADRHATGGSFERTTQETDAVAAIPAWSPLIYY